MEKIESLYPLIGAIAVVLGGVWFVVQQAFKLGIMSHRLDYVERNTNEIKISIACLPVIITRLDAIDKTLSSLPCSSHNDELVTIKSIMQQKFPTLSKSVALKSSPLRLSPMGLQIFNDVGGDEFLKANKDTLFKSITNSKPLTKLDVEQEANAAFFVLMNTPVFNKLKDYVYEASPITLENGEPYTLAIPDICFVLSIPLRDMYLKENPI